MTGKCSFLNNIQTMAERLTKYIGQPDEPICFPIESKGEARAAQTITPVGTDLWKRFGTWAKAEKYPVSLLLTRKEVIRLFGTSVALLRKMNRAVVVEKEGKLRIGFRKAQ